MWFRFLIFMYVVLITSLAWISNIVVDFLLSNFFVVLLIKFVWKLILIWNSFFSREVFSILFFKFFHSFFLLFVKLTIIAFCCFFCGGTCTPIFTNNVYSVILSPFLRWRYAIIGLLNLLEFLCGIGLFCQIGVILFYS